MSHTSPPPTTGPLPGPGRPAQVLLGLAAVAVAFAAADTYVVVLALPDMMGSVGLNIDQLQRAAPIVSGFLLGYVAMLPLIGRIADLRGRTPVLVAALVVFAFGSLVTAAAYDLGSLVTGRFLQGVGGGGLVPVTLALVADLYPAERRGVPLGVVGAVQELGSVLGPLYGAVVLSFGTWRDIFWINLAVGLVLAAAIATLKGNRPKPPGGRAASEASGQTRPLTPSEPEPPGAQAASQPEPPGGRAASEASGQTRPLPATRRAHLDWIGLLLLALTITSMLLVMRQPRSLVRSVDLGGPFVPFQAGTTIWFSPLGVLTLLLAVTLVGWLLLAKNPLVDLRGWWSSARAADLLGAGLLAIALGGVILAFATSDPEVQVFSPAGPYYLGIAAVGALLFALHNRRSTAPLVPHGAFAKRPAWGSLLVSFFVGAALIAALVDIPIFARITVADGSQLKSALVLLEFLIALPVGALAGGALSRRVPVGFLTAAGMLGAAIGFRLMAGWGPESLDELSSSAVLAATGFGFGLALAPVNAALLSSTAPREHGVTSALLVVSRMVGMLVGISALTTIGLRRYYAVETGIPPVTEVCPAGKTQCAAYTRLIEQAGIEQLQAIFLGAAICAVIAAVAAVWCFAEVRTPGRPHPRPAAATH